MVVVVKERVLIGLNAAVAERSVTSRFGRPGRPELVLSVPALISRTVVYGPVRTVVWEGGAARLLPIPICVLNIIIHAYYWNRHLIYRVFAFNSRYCPTSK